jgi:hypothetical protein
MPSRHMSVQLVIALVLVCSLTSVVVLPVQPARAQGDRVVITLEGTIIVLDDDLVQVEGYITAIAGPSDFEVGDWDVFSVVPTMRFRSAQFAEGAEVLLTGTLLSDGFTLRANRIELLEAEDDLGDGENDEEKGEREGCTAADPHPVGEKLAARFDVDYEQIMAWFCSGFGFGEIKLALQMAAALDGVTADALLARRGAGEGWGEIRRDLGVSPSQFAPGLAVGRPDGVGRPDNPGSQGRGQGKANK